MKNNTGKTILLFFIFLICSVIIIFSWMFFIHNEVSFAYILPFFFPSGLGVTYAVLSFRKIRINEQKDILNRSIAFSGTIAKWEYPKEEWLLFSRKLIQYKMMLYYGISLIVLIVMILILLAIKSVDIHFFVDLSFIFSAVMIPVLIGGIGFYRQLQSIYFTTDKPFVEVKYGALLINNKMGVVFHDTGRLVEVKIKKYLNHECLCITKLHRTASRNGPSFDFKDYYVPIPQSKKVNIKKVVKTLENQTVNSKSIITG